MVGESTSDSLAQEERSLVARVGEVEDRVRALSGRYTDTRFSGTHVEVTRALLPSGWPEDPKGLVKRLDRESNGAAEARHTGSVIEWKMPWKTRFGSRLVPVRLDRGGEISPVLRIRGRAGYHDVAELAMFGAFVALAVLGLMGLGLQPAVAMCMPILPALLILAGPGMLLQRRRSAKALAAIADRLEERLYALNDEEIGEAPEEGAEGLESLDLEVEVAAVGRRGKTRGLS